MPRILEPTKDTISEAAALIRAGRLVAFPTETVYGLGANALDGQAVAQIFEAKGRPSFNPLISHGDSAAMLEPHAVFDERARALAGKFWPGPLTMILPRAKNCRVSELVTAGLETIAVRVPAHKVALDLISAAGVPIAAPSANRSGELSPTSPSHVAQSLGDAVDMILAGGAAKYGLESTVLDLTGDHPAIVRPGAVSAEDISALLECPIPYELEVTDKPRSPGQLLRHYAPSVPLRLNAVDVEPGEALLAFGSTKFMGVMGGGFAHDLPHESFRNLSEDGDLFEAAANLFGYLRALDLPEHKSIAVMAIPDTGIGVAINDRLRRAAGATNKVRRCNATG
jgi:L-threonylcarbamoyladenylate synthase